MGKSTVFVSRCPDGKRCGREKRVLRKYSLGGKRFLVAGYCYEFILRILTPPKKAEKVRFGGVLLREK